MRPAPWFVLLVAATVTHPREADAQVFTPKVILAGHKGGGGAVCFSADGSLLATNGFSDGNVKLWEVATGHERATLKTGGNKVLRIAFTPEGSVMAIVPRSRKIRRRGETSNWDLLVLGPDPAKAPIPFLPDEFVYSFAYSPDGKTLAVGSETRLVFLDASTGQVQATLMTGQPIALGLAFSRDGSTLAVDGWDSFIRLWDVATRKELSVLHDPLYPSKGVRVFAPVFSPDGKYLAAGSQLGMARVWYLSSLDPIGTLKGARGSVAYSPDGKLLAASCGKTLTLWEANTFVERAKIDAHNGGFVVSAAFSPDGKLVATRGGDGIVKIWETSHLLSGGSPAPAPSAVKARSGDGK